MKSSNKGTVLPLIATARVIIGRIGVDVQSLLLNKRFRCGTQFVMRILHQTVIFDAQRRRSDDAELLRRRKMALHDDDTTKNEIFVAIS
jgi:hypothetical protein